MKFDFTKAEPILETKIVKVKRMNHIVEVVSIQNKPKSLEGILKLSKTEYMKKDTGEVLRYNLSENRGQNVAGMKDTFRKIRDLINNNFIGGENEIHLTLTYGENMKDTTRLYSDFKYFWKKYKSKYGNNVDYLTVVEPQGRGAWHCHVLIRHNDKGKVYIPSKELAKLWGHGFIKVKALDGVDNIGAYLSAYLGDVELTPENLKEVMARADTNVEIKEVKADGKTKAFIKGGRCYMYPPGMNLYRHSKGIVFPEVEEMPYKELKKIVGSATPNYSRTLKIMNDENDLKVLNQVTYEHYNTKRTKLE